MLKKFFRRRDKGEDIANELYLGAVAQARLPVFYAEHGVPDTLDGRFDLIVLHVYLLLRPLNAIAKRAAGQETDADGAAHQQSHQQSLRASELSQTLFDTMFGDMDRSLREMGVSDIAVGKRVKQMAKAFYGRVSAYDEGLVDPEALEAPVEERDGGPLGEVSDIALDAALERNLFGTVNPTAAQVSAMAEYLRCQVKHLDATSDDAVLTGQMQFAPWP